MPAEPFYPQQAPIDAYGNGGFRFADLSHRGSLLLLPSGVYAWPVATAAALEVGDFARALVEQPPIEFLLFGGGERPGRPDKSVLDAFRAAGIGLDSMDTGAAVRTYNVLLAERRLFGAALIAVDNPR